MSTPMQISPRGNGGHRPYTGKRRRVVNRGPRYGRPGYPAPIRGQNRGYHRVGGYYGRYRGGPGEVKFHDIDIDDAVITAGVNVTDSVNKIAQDTTEVTRIGRKCTITKISWRFECTLPELNAQTGHAAGDVVRILLYVDKQCNGATIASTDLLESADYQSFNNLANKGRFRTLMDKTYDLNYLAGSGITASTDAADYRISGSFYKDCKIPIEFDSVAGAITEIRSNNIGVLLMSRNGTAGFFSKMRLRFDDG